MKKLQLLLMLLSIPCVSISQSINQTKDSLSLGKAQVKNVYVGLVQGENCKVELKKAITVINRQNEIIHAINNEVVEFSEQNKELNFKMDQISSEIAKKDFEIKSLKNVPWFKKNRLWLGIGIVGGILIGSKL